MRGEKGQTTIEYLLLTAVAFLTSYLMITGPVGNFTRGMVDRLRGSMANIVQNGELAAAPNGQAAQPGDSNHPSDPSRAKRLH